MLSNRCVNHYPHYPLYFASSISQMSTYEARFLALHIGATLARKYNTTLIIKTK